MQTNPLVIFAAWGQFIIAIVTMILLIRDKIITKKMQDIIDLTTEQGKQTAELITQTTIANKRLQIARQEQFKINFPFLTGIILDSDDEIHRVLQIRNIGAPIAELRTRNHNSDKFRLDNIGSPFLGRDPINQVIRYDAETPFDNLHIDFSYRTMDGADRIQSFHKVPGMPGSIDPPEAYLAIE